MSHFTVIRTQVVETGALKKALEDLGFKTVEVHEAAQHLYGYQGDRRAQTAEVIIRRKFVGGASNDIGFKRSEKGTFDAIISDYDRLMYNQACLNRLAQRYAYHATIARLEEQGFNVAEEETRTNGAIHLVLRRMAYVWKTAIANSSAYTPCLSAAARTAPG